MSEPLEYKIDFYIDSRRYKTKKSQDAARARAAREFLDNGSEMDPESNEVIPGVRMVASWRNPENRKPQHSNWKSTTDRGQSLTDFHYTLHGQRGALRDFARRYGR